jgi:polysaccharide pyruvyl transferase WcaK-like protein
VIALRWQSILKSAVARRGEVLRWLRSFDLILDTRAGDSFTDIYGTKRLRQMSMLPFLAKAVGVPVVLAPQTIGPFETRQGRVIARAVLSSADLVFARDSTSLEICSQYPLSRPPEMSTDVAFALKSEAAPKTHDVLLNISGLLWNPNPHVAHESYRRVIRTLHAGLTERGRRVTLLEHVLHEPGMTGDTDGPAGEEFRALHAPDTDIITPTSLEDVRTAVASARVVFGSRMHAALNAMSVGTPAIPMAYSRKFAPLFESIGWPFVVDLRDPDIDLTAIMDLVCSDVLNERAADCLATARARLESSARTLRFTI